MTIRRVLAPAIAAASPPPRAAPPHGASSSPSSDVVWLPPGVSSPHFDFSSGAAPARPHQHQHQYFPHQHQHLQQQQQFFQPNPALGYRLFGSKHAPVTFDAPADVPRPITHGTSPATVSMWQQTPSFYYDTNDDPASHLPLFVTEDAAVVSFVFTRGEHGLAQDAAFTRAHNHKYSRQRAHFAAAKMKQLCADATGAPSTGGSFKQQKSNEWRKVSGYMHSCLRRN